MLKNVLLMGSLDDFVMEAFCNLCYCLNFFDFLTSKLLKDTLLMLKNVLLVGSLDDFVMETFCNLCYRLNFFNFLTS